MTAVATSKVCRLMPQRVPYGAYSSTRENGLSVSAVVRYIGQGLILGLLQTLTMRFNGIGTGFAVSFLLFFPIGYLDVLLAFNNSIGNWALSSLMMPYLIYFGMAFVLRWRGYGGLGEGLAIGGAVFSTLVVFGIFFIALTFSMLADA